MVTPLERYREKQARDARREDAKRQRGGVPEWLHSPLFNWFVTVVVIGAISFYYSHHRHCIDENQEVIAKSSALIEEIKARLSVTYVFYQNAGSLDELMNLRKQGADVQNAVLGTSNLFYLYRQLLREQHAYVNGAAVDTYIAAASGIIFPTKSFDEAMTDAAVLISTDIVPKDFDDNASFAQIKELAFRSIQLMLFHVNFIEHQLKAQSCTPSTILRDAFTEFEFNPRILTPTQMPPPNKLTPLDVYALAPIVELAPRPPGPPVTAGNP